MTPREMYGLTDIVTLVEEIKSKVYNVTMGKIATLIEALAPDRIVDKPSWRRLDEAVARLLDSQLDHVTNAIMDVVKKHIPDITPEMLAAAKEKRLESEAMAETEALANRVTTLRESLSRAERELQRRSPGLGLPQKVQ